MSESKKDYTAAAEWAEHHDVPETSHTLRGDDAAAYAREQLQRAGVSLPVGRPKLDPNETKAGRSPHLTTNCHRIVQQSRVVVLRARWDAFEEPARFLACPGMQDLRVPFTAAAVGCLETLEAACGGPDQGPDAVDRRVRQAEAVFADALWYAENTYLGVGLPSSRRVALLDARRAYTAAMTSGVLLRHRQAAVTAVQVAMDIFGVPVPAATLAQLQAMIQDPPPTG